MGSTEPDVLVRDYVEGDSLKQVHWKITAREQKLKVRVMTGKENQSIVIFCDTRRYSEDMGEYLPLENKILEAFLAVGHYFAGMERAFTAYYGQNGVVERQVAGSLAFDNFYHQVSTMAFGDSENFQNLLEQVTGRGALWGSSLVFCILHELNPGIMNVTDRLAARGVIVVLYVIADQVPEDYIKQGSARRRIVVIPVEAELEGKL